MEDIEMKCIFCGNHFTFTAEEQKFYQKQGFRPPKRCPDCIEEKHRMNDMFSL
ncbi:MAG: zinc-ribbon domain containing protein [Candidatus Firestonebacteria bacterium]|nr:zinc-ribbon domain containing protein [Candidatus Firestonebacteria bacterium]